MSQPPQVPPVPDWVATTPEWASPAAGWAAAHEGWAPPAPPGTAPAPSRRPGNTAVVLIALAALAAGVVAGAAVVTAVFVVSAVDIGRGIGEGMTASMDGAYSSTEDELAWGAYPPLAPEDVGDPVAPVPGPDPVLNAYAQDCFDGNYQECDDLYFESPPLSAYEEYAETCAGRVKPFTVESCTELD